jgi:predicted ATP-grasp superfamily ATP-dependent carboligase
LEQAWQELFPRERGRAVLQAFVRGTPALATFAAFEGQLLAVLTAEKTETHGPFGPGRVLTFVRDDKMVAAASAFARTVGFSGIGSLDFIRNEDRGTVAIEFNPRPTPVTGLSEKAGVDLCAALLHGVFGSAKWTGGGDRARRC